MNLQNYYLDLEKVFKLTESEQKIIHDLYRDMLFAESDGRPKIGESYFNTLTECGYFVDKRDKKISDILDE